MRAILLALSLTACASAATQSAAPVNADAVVAAERGFAARAGEIGWIPAFREFTAPDGMVGNFENAPQSLAQTPDDGSRTLYWWPVYAGISRSGDLGFTTGPFSVDEARTPRGQYFTVWRRQPDGSWKWIWDGGAGPVTDPGPPHTASDLSALPVAARGVGSDEARRQVEFIERSFSNSTEVAAYLAEEAHVYRSGQPRAVGGMMANGAVVATDPRYEIRRIESSEAGDLVFVLGAAQWTRDGQERQGQFARMWQLGPEGWRIVYDQLTGRPPG